MKLFTADGLLYEIFDFFHFPYFFHQILKLAFLTHFLWF
jgi:hypothetical protein